MLRAIRNTLAAIILVAIAGGCIMWWHNNEMSKLNQEIQAEQERKEQMDQRILEIQAKLDDSETEKENLLDQIDTLLTEEEMQVDSAAMMEEIREIGELTTVEYRYTNVGTIDAVDKFSFVDWNVPFSEKTAVVTMDGVIKAGIDVTEVQITVDDADREITVRLPEAKIVSNELFEDSLAVYVEEESLFSDLTLDDSSSLRADIQAKAEENAIDSGLLQQAKVHAGDLIKCLIEASLDAGSVYHVIVQ